VKRIISGLFCLLLVCALCLPALATSEEPVITQQPQSPYYSKYDTAIYTVKATGSNLTATWYLEYEGKTYNLSDATNGFEPWEAYAGETYGPQQNDSNTFSCFFGGIEEELNGARIWCVIEDGHYDVTSEKATICVGDYAEPPTIVDMPASLTVEQGDEAELRCVAKSNSDAQLSYIWYETTTGKLEDIQALNRGTETSDYITCDTSIAGTRYYVCCVSSTDGGMIYSNVVPVTVTPFKAPEKPAATEPKQEPTEPAATEAETQPVEQTEAPAEVTEAPTEQAQPAPQTIPETVPETQPAPQNDVDNSTPWWAFVLIGVIAAAAGVGVAVLLTIKKS